MKSIREMSERNAKLTDPLAESPLMKSIREMSERNAKLTDPLAESLARDQRVYDRISQPILPLEPISPNLIRDALVSPEVRASEAIEEQTARLVAVSTRTSEQIGQLAKIARGRRQAGDRARRRGRRDERRVHQAAGDDDRRREEGRKIGLGGHRPDGRGGVPDSRFSIACAGLPCSILRAAPATSCTSLSRR